MSQSSKCTLYQEILFRVHHASSSIAVTLHFQCSLYLRFKPYKRRTPHPVPKPAFESSFLTQRRMPATHLTSEAFLKERRAVGFPKGASLEALAPFGGFFGSFLVRTRNEQRHFRVGDRRPASQHKVTIYYISSCYISSYIVSKSLPLWIA